MFTKNIIALVRYLMCTSFALNWNALSYSIMLFGSSYKFCPCFRSIKKQIPVTSTLKSKLLITMSQKLLNAAY